MRVSPLKEWYDAMEEAERADGWLAWCERRRVYVAPNCEFLDEMAQLLESLPQPLLEVASGDGMLADTLRHAGLAITASDPSPAGQNVDALGAEEALRRYQPATVLACFPPIDTAIEQCVLKFESVERFVYIGPLIHDRPGPECLWRSEAWRAETLPRINDVLLTRLDYLVDFTRATHQRGAASVLFRRKRASSR